MAQFWCSRRAAEGGPRVPIQWTRNLGSDASLRDALFAIRPLEEAQILSIA